MIGFSRNIAMMLFCGENRQRRSVSGCPTPAGSCPCTMLPPRTMKWSAATGDILRHRSLGIGCFCGLTVRPTRRRYSSTGKKPGSIGAATRPLPWKSRTWCTPEREISCLSAWTPGRIRRYRPSALSLIISPMVGCTGRSGWKPPPNAGWRSCLYIPRL